MVVGPSSRPGRKHGVSIRENRMAAAVLHLQMKDSELGRRTGLARSGHPAVRQMLTESGYAVEP